MSENQWKKTKIVKSEGKKSKIMLKYPQKVEKWELEYIENLGKTAKIRGLIWASRKNLKNREKWAILWVIVDQKTWKTRKSEVK